MIPRRRPKVPKGAAPYVPPPIGELLKANLAVLGILVAFCGLVSTEAYYSSFGLRYQTLGIGIEHIAYRGVTALFSSVWLFAIYLAAFVWLGSDAWLDRMHRWYGKVKLGLSLAGIILFVVAGYTAARQSGLSQAAEDLDARTTKLVRIVSLNIDDKACQPACDFSGYRMVYSDSDAIYVTRPTLDGLDAAKPILRRLSKAAIQRLELSGV